MVEEITGSHDGEQLNVAIVVSEFNSFVTDKLLDGALEALKKCGVSEDSITVVQVPGAFEIPGTARRIRAERDPDGILCLGAVIRGETPHFDHICSHVTDGVGRLSYEADFPVIFGVLTTDTVDQAIERAGTKSGNKGHEAAMTLVETANVYSQL